MNKTNTDKAKQATFNFPTRLSAGKGIVGPDWPGCINSGTAPVVMKSKLAAKYLGKPFVAGGVYPVKWDLAKCISAAMAGRRTDDMKRFKVRFFKTYAAAKRHFLRVLSPIAEQYEIVRTARKTLRAAQVGSTEQMQAAMVLHDNGEI